MPTTTSITNSIKRPFTANKRLFTLLTVAFVIIGLFFALYYSYIRSNEVNFREYKLQSLDSNFDILSKQLTNDFQKFYSRYLDALDRNAHYFSKDTQRFASIRDSVWHNLETRNLSPIFEQEFNEYIVIFKNKGATGTHPEDTILEKSSLKGRIVLPDTLYKLNPFNIGMSLGIPEEDKKYQLFGREYKFTTSLDDAVVYEITILGLMEAELYNEATRKLDPWIIALLTFFLLLALFGMPYFKMLFIAEDERLSSHDVIMAGISVIVGAPIILIVFLSVMYHYHDYYHRVPEELHRMGQDIKDGFERENDSIVTELSNLSMDRWEGMMDSTLLVHEIRDTDSTSDLKDQVKFISRIDAQGKVLYHLSFINKEEIKGTKNLSSRPYYQDFHKKTNVWFIDMPQGSVDYVLRPVVSIEDQTEEAIYILRNEKDALRGYRVGASQLQSIHEPVLPFGYQFAIVDETGEVWFHSEKRRATLENFFNVSRNNGKLKAAMAGRVRAQGLVNYRDQGKLFSVLPLQGTNLSVITLYDIGLLRTRISEVLTLACVALVLAILLMLVITVLSLAIRNPKLGLYKYDRFLFEFLTPKKEYREAYILLALLFYGVLCLAMLMGTFLTVPPLNVFVICLLLAIYTYMIVFYTLHPYRNTPDVKFRVRDTLLLMAIIALNAIMFRLNTDNLGFFAFALVIQAVCIAAIVLGQFHALPDTIRGLCRYNPFRIHIAYRYWYALFLFGWLSLASIYPAYLFFEKAKTMNDQIWLKIDQIAMGGKYLEKKQVLSTNLPPFPTVEDSAAFERFHQRHLRKGQYHAMLEVRDQSDKKASNQMAKTGILEDFLWKARPIFNDSINRFQGLVYPMAQDSSWRTDGNGRYLILQDLHGKESVEVWKREANGSTNVPLDVFFLRTAGILLILVLLFSLILFFTDRFFGFRFRHLRPSYYNTQRDGDDIEQFVQVLQDESSNSGILLVGLPFSGKGSFAERILKTSGYTKMTTLSMLQLDTVDPKADVPTILNVLAGYSTNDKGRFDYDAYEAFIIEHLEHNIKSFQANHTKLKTILFLISRKKRIVLISEVYPSQIFAMYEQASDGHGLPQGMLEDDFNSWRNILSAFPQVLIGITENPDKVTQKLRFGLDKNLHPSPQAVAILKEELGYSKFLPTLAPIVLSKTLYESNSPKDRGLRLDRQRMVMHTQNLAHGYYNDIWNALPTRERYLLYDLAKDSFMNIKNRNSLFSLMKKGLIVWRDRPTIFNSSFKNFIMTSVSLNEALRLENKNRGKGTWANTRILLYLVIITAIVFIALGKPELLKDFEALIGTLGGLGVIIPLISKLLASSGQKS